MPGNYKVTEPVKGSRLPVVMLCLGVAAVVVLAGIALVPLKAPGRKQGSYADRMYARMMSETGDDAKVTAIALAEAGDTRALPKLKEIMESEDHGMMAVAVEALGKGRLKHPDVLEMLLAAARDEHDGRHRGLSLRSLERTGLVSHPRAVAFLLERAEGDDTMAQRCILALASVRPPVTKELIDLFDRTPADQSPNFKKMWIISALGRVGDEAALSKLRTIAESDDQELAERARQALNPPKEKPVPPGQPPDFWKRMEEMDRQVKEDVYGRDKDREVSVMISLVMHYAYDENPGMVEEAKRSLDRTMAAAPKVRDHELTIIKGLLKHKDPKVRAAAAKALEYCKSLQEQKAPGGG